MRFKIRFFTFLLFTFLCSPLEIYAQCENNLIQNGSLDCMLGSDVTAGGWYLLGSPDCNDNSGILNTSTGYVWSGGLPIPSTDGGTWQTFYAQYPPRSTTPPKWA